MIYKSIDFSQLTDEEVLFFIRIRGKNSYFNDVYGQRFLGLFSSIKSYRCISEYKKDANVHIDINAVSRDYLYENEYNQLTELSSIENLIKRCRGLRAIAYTDAVKLIARTYLFFIEFYTKNPQLRLVVTGAIDNYVMDLMVRIGESFKVTFFGLTGSLMSPEYQLSTVRGEITSLGSVDKASVNSFADKVLSNVKSCGVPKISSIISRAVYNYASYHYRFVVRYLFKYKILGRLEYEYRFAPYLYGFKSLRQIFAPKYLNDANHLYSISKKQKAYIPLHWYPEATTDYWIKSLYHVDYFSSVMNTIDRLQKMGYEVYAKEHPHFILSRESDFYEALKQKECYLLSPFVCTKLVFDNVDLVVVWNGSTGIESLLYGKETKKVVNSYYGDGLVPDLDQLDDNETRIDLKSIAGLCIEKAYSSSFRTR